MKKIVVIYSNIHDKLLSTNLTNNLKNIVLKKPKNRETIIRGPLMWINFHQFGPESGSHDVHLFVVYFLVPYPCDF